MESRTLSPSPSPSPPPRVVIVTGASRGYGAAIVRELLRLPLPPSGPGCRPIRIVATARSPSLPATMAAIAPDDTIACVVGDIRSDATARRIVDTAVSRWGRIDCVVHNAGIVDPLGPLASSHVSAAALRDIFDINVVAVAQLTTHCMQHLRASRGRILLVSSGASHNAYVGMGAYCVSKAALNMYAKCIKAEEPDVTCCVALRPGVLDTDMQAHLRDPAVAGLLHPDVHGYFTKAHAEGTLVPPEKSARVAAQLCLYATPEMNGELVDWEDAAVLQALREGAEAEVQAAKN